MLISTVYHEQGEIMLTKATYLQWANNSVTRLAKRLDYFSKGSGYLFLSLRLLIQSGISYSLGLLFKDLGYLWSDHLVTLLTY